MRIVSWDAAAWDQYVWWQTQDKKTLIRINHLIRDIQRNENDGIGKPEPLRHEFSGYWSRRIDPTNRLVYKLTDTAIVIISCRYHYGS